MDPQEANPPDSQSTQPATQKFLDPRRLGKQNSGFSDDDIADIVCLLLPCSEGARAELREMALRTSTHIIEADEDAHPDLHAEDGLNHIPDPLVGEHAIVLRLSAQVKDPLQGFTFGRNIARCDVCFANDPRRRLSNIHFRIYLNDYGVLMLEDSSMNGTIVDGTVLKGREGRTLKPGEPKSPKQRTLSPGSEIKILMVDRDDDFIFIVQVPRRQGEHEEAYRKNLARYIKDLHRLRIEDEEGDAAKTITPGPTGHIDIFPVKDTRRTTPRAKRRVELPKEPTEKDLGRLPKEWNGSDKYNRVGRIGKGAFATVYQVTSKFNGRPYAAKELDKRRFMKDGVLDQKVENEMKIMQRVKHTNIVEYIEHLDWENRLLIIIMEFVPNGDLGGLIGGHGPLKEVIVKQMASQLISALAYLHANNITHRDVKPDNILVHSYDPFTVKLTDFGLSKMVDTEQTFLKTFCGTLLYCAPEVYNEFSEYDEYGHRHPRNRLRRRPVGQRYDHAIDIWSLGGVLYFALTGDAPFPAKNGISYTELLHQIMTKRLNTQPLSRMDVSDDGIDFLMRMLQRRPEQRATMEELRAHPWLAGTDCSQEQPGTASTQDEEIDDELGKEASQLTLEDTNAADDGFDLIPERFGEEETEDTEFECFASQKENYTFEQLDKQHPRLYGEISATGSIDAVPADRLNLPVSETILNGTEIYDSEIRDSYGSEDSTPRQAQARGSQPTPRAAIPAALTQSRRSASRSVTELNNMTFDAESQDLGGAESQLENLNMKSLAPNLQSDFSNFTTSKRKPSHDSSEEFDSTPRARPAVKRLRSEAGFDTMSCSEETERNLYSQMPPLSRINSNRQIDKPVHKSAYWDARDKKSWHLSYPEMTQLQHDAFESAAKTRGEVFAPGRSPLWDFAMKHFPPSGSSSILGQSQPFENVRRSSDHELKALDRGSVIQRAESAPPGSAADDEDMPDTLPPDFIAVAPAQADPPLNRTVASLESAKGSVVSGISILINQAMVSWGRAPDNTHIYTPRMESKVPKFALKLVLWKEGYEPYSKNFRPWNGPGDGFFFYISTKATHGIQINRTVLPSHEPKNPRGPSQNWIRLHDGDTVVFWRSGDDEGHAQAKLTFRCRWGGSSQPRDGVFPAEVVPPDVADRLDASCRKAEERIGKLAEYDQRLHEADLDAVERQKNIERERQRSQDFEAKRLEACRVLAIRASRRSSPAITQYSAPPTTGYFGNGAMTVNKGVPSLKHASALLEGGALQSMAEE